MQHAVAVWTEGAIGAAFVVGFAFLAIYTVRARSWWRYPESRALGVAFLAVLFGTLPAILRTLFGFDPGHRTVFAVFQLAAYVVADLLLGWSVWVMWYDLRAKRRPRPRGER
jgi:hypothetical protein